MNTISINANILKHTIDVLREKLEHDVPAEGPFLSIAVPLTQDNAHITTLSIGAFQKDSEGDFPQMRYIQLHISLVDSKRESSLWVYSGTRDQLIEACAHDIPERIQRFYPGLRARLEATR